MHVKQQARIPAAAPFVDVDEPYFQIGKLRGALLVNDRQPLRRLLQRHLRRRDGGVGRRDFLGGDVALKFELTKITEDRARLRGEAIRFCLQCANPLVDTPRERIGRVAIDRLRAGQHDERDQNDDRCRQLHHAPSIKSPGAIRGA